MVAAWQRALGERGLTAGRFFTIYKPGGRQPDRRRALRRRFEGKRDADLGRSTNAWHRWRSNVPIALSARSRRPRAVSRRVIPALDQMLARWRKRTLIGDAVVAALLIGGFIAIIETRSMGRNAFERGLVGYPDCDADEHVFHRAGHLPVVVGGALRRASPGRQNLFGPAERLGQKLGIRGSLGSAFAANTRFWRSIFARHPAGWSRRSRRRIQRVLEDADRYVQDLNDQLHQPVRQSATGCGDRPTRRTGRHRPAADASDRRQSRLNLADAVGGQASDRASSVRDWYLSTRHWAVFAMGVIDTGHPQQIRAPGHHAGQPQPCGTGTQHRRRFLRRLGTGEMLDAITHNGRQLPVTCQEGTSLPVVDTDQGALMILQQLPGSSCRRFSAASSSRGHRCTTATHPGCAATRPGRSHPGRVDAGVLDARARPLARSAVPRAMIQYSCMSNRWQAEVFRPPVSAIPNAILRTTLRPRTLTIAPARSIPVYAARRKEFAVPEDPRTQGRIGFNRPRQGIDIPHPGLPPSPAVSQRSPAAAGWTRPLSIVEAAIFVLHWATAASSIFVAECSGRLREFLTCTPPQRREIANTWTKCSNMTVC